jgi:hypothetical protein
MLFVEDRPATLNDWLDGRSPVHLSTNTGTPLVAFQAWRAFKEAFAPELIAQAFEETSLVGPLLKPLIRLGGRGQPRLPASFSVRRRLPLRSILIWPT